MNAAEAASATIIAKGSGDAFALSATFNAIGAISTAVAVFETNSPTTAVNTNSQAKIGRAHV